MKKLLYTILSLVIVFASKSVVLADGGVYNPYNPYNPHTPVDTGLINDPIYFVGIVMLIAGLSLLLNANSLKSKLKLS